MFFFNLILTNIRTQYHACKEFVIFFFLIALKNVNDLQGQWEKKKLRSVISPLILIITPSNIVDHTSRNFVENELILSRIFVARIPSVKCDSFWVNRLPGCPGASLSRIPREGTTISESPPPPLMIMFGGMRDGPMRNTGRVCISRNEVCSHIKISCLYIFFVTREFYVRRILF